MSVISPVPLISAVAGPPPGITTKPQAGQLDLTPQTAQDFFRQFQSLVRQQRIPEYALIIVLSTALIFIVTSFLKDIVLPPIALLLSPFDLPDWKIMLRPATMTKTMTKTTVSGKQKKKVVVGKRELSIKLGDFIEVAAISALLAILAYWLLSRRRAMEDAQGAAALLSTPSTTTLPLSTSRQETMNDDADTVVAQQKLILFKLEQLDKLLRSRPLATFS